MEFGIEMFARKDVKRASKVLFFTVLIGVSLEVRPAFALTKAKKEMSNPAQNGKTQSGTKTGVKNAAPSIVTGLSNSNLMSKTGVKNAVPLQYKVNSGDNLYRISIKYNVSLDELIRANNLKNNDICAGMMLKIPSNLEKSEKPVSVNSGRKIFFDWPVKKITFYKEDGFDGVKSIGIIISAPIGSLVHSSAQGTVEKVGFMRGYGNFVLVKHPDNYFTIYSYLEDVRVKKGQAVNKGAIIGCVDPDKKSMHFQIDHNGKPINPLNHLPKKN